MKVLQSSKNIKFIRITHSASAKQSLVEKYSNGDFVEEVKM